MSTRREKSKQQKTQEANQQETAENTLHPIPNQRKEKLSNFLIDIAKYVFTGVIITSLFNDVTDKATLYLTGMFIVMIALWMGLLLTNVRKEK